MRASDFDELDHFETEGLLTGSKERNWLWLGLIISLAIHFALCTYFYRTRFASADAVFAQNEQTPTFKVKRVLDSNLDKSSADQISPAEKPNPDNTDVQLPDEKKSFDKLLQEVQASTALPDDMRDVLPDQPKVEQPDVNSVLNEIERSTAQTLSNDPNAVHEQSLLNNSCGIRPSAACSKRNRAGHQHGDQAAEHFHKQAARRQRWSEQRTRTGVQRFGPVTGAKRSARVRHKIASARRSDFRVRQRRAAIGRDRSTAKTGHAYSAQLESDIFRGRLHGFIRHI